MMEGAERQPAQIHYELSDIKEGAQYQHVYQPYSFADTAAVRTWASYQDVMRRAWPS